MQLAVQTREKFGKGVKTLREQGLVPAELYGKGIKNLHLTVPLKDFRKVFKEAGESTMIDVVLTSPAGEEKRPAMIYNVAVNPVTDEILNIDLYQVRLDEKIKIRVSLEFIGESFAVKNKNGILVKAMQELEVEGLPGSIPKNITVDVAKLDDIGKSIHVKDLSLPNGVKFLVDEDNVIATVTAQMTEEEEAKLSTEVKVEEIKSETEEKKEARAAEKAVPVEETPKPAEKK
ncbi:MAG: 50S ribosomal protein L25 [Candidatus Harrisonbacteria bacterium]|nr:50S ribosomal protein L25 [Candidatus Harrisonbacteria bacterium]